MSENYEEKMKANKGIQQKLEASTVTKALPQALILRLVIFGMNVTLSGRISQN